MFWQTAVQIKIWRGRVKGGGRKGIEIQQQIHRGKKKKGKSRNNLPEELSMVYFKAKKLHCGLDDVYSSQAKEKCLAGLHLEHPALRAGIGDAQPCTRACWSGLTFSSGAVPVAALYRCTGLWSLAVWHGIKFCGFNALKSLHLQV